MQQIFHTGDQKILENFKDLTYERPEEHSENQLIQALSVGIEPVSGDFDSYDFNLSLNDEELGFLGV
jgi:hypothetical protein